MHLFRNNKKRLKEHKQSRKKKNLHQSEHRKHKKTVKHRQQLTQTEWLQRKLKSEEDGWDTLIVAMVTHKAAKVDRQLWWRNNEPRCELCFVLTFISYERGKLQCFGLFCFCSLFPSQAEFPHFSRVKTDDDDFWVCVGFYFLDNSLVSAHIRISDFVADIKATIAS